MRPRPGRRRSSWRPSCCPDVVLMDINMPDMDGIAATEQLSAEVPDRRGRHDVGPGRGGLPPPVDARRRARVPRQAVQQRRAHRLDPAGLRARAGEAEPDRAAAPVMAASDGGGARGARRRRRSRRPGHRGLQPEGRRRPDDDRGQPGGRGRDRARQVGRPGGRLVPVRRRRRPAQPQPEEQVDRGPRPGARGRRAGVARHVRHQPLGRRPGPARPALARDGRADHADGRQARPRGAPPAARPRHRRLHRLVQRDDAGDPRRGRHRS